MRLIRAEPFGMTPEVIPPSALPSPEHGREEEP
jgi:hypothetical protein